jgi:hypothetical protein
MQSQFVTASRTGVEYQPLAFTEHGKLSVSPMVVGVMEEESCA